MNNSIAETGHGELYPMNFEAAMTVIARHFREAVEMQARAPDFRHIMNDRNPNAITIPLGSFMLAQSYELAIEGRGDNFEIAVPIKKASVDSPEPAVDGDAAFFIVDYRESGHHKSVLVTEADYRPLFVDSLGPPIEDFPFKLDSYQVIPSSRFAA